jgi:flagellar basal-body rod modification protein FlgD
MSNLSIDKTSALSPMAMLSQNASTAKTKAQAAATGSSTTSSSGGLSSTTTGTTFLNLLVKELQNQDPTAPMDSTAMVGQMISLNQLDQLISINQTLGTATGTSTTSSVAPVSGQASANSSSSTDLMAARASLLNNTYAPTSADSATSAASDPNSTLDFSKLNIPYGGK